MATDSVQQEETADLTIEEIVSKLLPDLAAHKELLQVGALKPLCELVDNYLNSTPAGREDLEEAGRAMRKAALRAAGLAVVTGRGAVAPEDAAPMTEPRLNWTRAQFLIRDEDCARFPQPRSLVGAYEAGTRAAAYYLKILRARGVQSPVSDLTAVTKTILLGKEKLDFGRRGIMLFGFLGELQGVLAVGAQLVEEPEEDVVTIEEQIQACVAKTERQVNREFNSERAKRGWKARRERAAEVA
jgi:hypothetical protein